MFIQNISVRCTLEQP